MQWWYVWEDKGTAWEFAFWYYGNVFQATDFANFLISGGKSMAGGPRYAVSSPADPNRFLGSGW